LVNSTTYEAHYAVHFLPFWSKYSSQQCFQYFPLFDVFLCLGHAQNKKKTGGLKPFVTVRNIGAFYGEMLAPTFNLQIQGPRLVGCPQLLIQHLRNYTGSEI
jgi:hypothetical protein